MPNDDHWDFDAQYDQDVEREPAHARPPRRSTRPQLDARGTLRTMFDAPPYAPPYRDRDRLEALHDRFDTVEERRGDK